MNAPETLTPETARQTLDTMPKRLADEIANRSLGLVMKQDELRWRYKSNNPCTPHTPIFDPEAYLKYLRGEYYEELQEGGPYVAKPLLLKRLMRMLFEYEQSSTSDSQTIDIGISWNASPMSTAQGLRNNMNWKLTKGDLKFLENIRVASADGSGSKHLVVYIKCDLDAEVYRLVNSISKVSEFDILNILASVEHKDGTLLEHLEEKYEAHVKKTYEDTPGQFHLNLLGMLCHVTDSTVEYFAYTFADYIKHSIRLLRHRKLRLKTAPLTISDKRKTPSFFFFDRDKLKPGEYQAWTDWMLIIPPVFRPVFMAWIYSIFDPKNTGRQALWMQGDGFEGKSQMIGAISDYMDGVGVVAINTGAIKRDFAFSTVYGKRLAVFMDCHNEHFMHQGFILTLLGGDLAPIEYKGLGSFTARVTAKLIIASNITPQVDISALNEISRIIYMPLQKAPLHIRKRYFATNKDGSIAMDEMNNPYPIGFQGDKNCPEFKDLLCEQMPAFLHACLEHYEELCPHRKEIKISDEIRRVLYTTCISQKAEAYMRFINARYEFTDNPDDAISILEIRNTATKYFESDTGKKYFKEYREPDYLLSFKRIALRNLEALKIDVDQYVAVQREIDGISERSYIYVKAKRKSAGRGVI